MSAGVVAAHYVASTPANPVIVESPSNAFTTITTSWTVTISNTPQPGDVLILSVLHIGTLGTTSVSGCGATWTAQETHETAGQQDQTVWVGSNATSSGTITVTSATARQGVVRAVLVRALATTTVTSSYAATNITNAATTGPSVTASPGQLVLAMASISSNSTSIDHLFSATTPSTGWATDTDNTTSLSIQQQDASIQPTSSAQAFTVTCSTTGSGRRVTICMLVLG